MEIITRQEAIKQGLKYYYTGKPCPKNHLSKRKVHNSVCYQCNQEERNLYDKENKSSLKGRNIRYYAKNKDKIKKRVANWQENNRGLYNSMNAKYRAKKLSATPSWADLKAITEFYKACPEGMVVDHIIPLQGKLVSGFHCVENLQYLTKSENSKKYNTFEPLYTTRIFKT